jgi:hypothetical protein
MSRKPYQIVFNYTGHDANTLDATDIGNHLPPDGWNVEGEVHEDYYEWVNEFSATKRNWKVWGDFEKIVYATNKKAYEDFIKYHPAHEWDYWDI